MASADATRSAVIAGFARTPFHFARKGALVSIRPDDLLAQLLREFVDRLRIDPNTIEDVICGCAYPEAEQGSNVARIASFLAGLPQTIAAATINRFCGSSMNAVHIAVGSIASGAGEAFVCVGVESMTRVPQGGLNPSPNPILKSEFPDAYIPMGITAENVARQFKVSRVEQQELSVQSHAKAVAAREAGKFEPELVSVTLPDQTVVSADGCIRAGTNQEVLSTLKPAFDPAGSVTAGTSSPLTDGASAVFVCSESYARTHGLEVLARVRSTAVAGCPPAIMGMGPVPASRKALERAALSTDQIDVVEINEAFASQAIACLRELSIDTERVNVDGGALAIGHPLGATGARLVGKLASLMTREGKRYGLATQCIGGGQGIATVLER